MKTVRSYWGFIGIQDILTIGKISRKQSRVLNGNFLIIRYKKSQIKEKILGIL